MCKLFFGGFFRMSEDSVFKMFRNFMIVKVRFYVSLVMINYVVFVVIEVCQVKVYWCRDCIISFNSFVSLY